VSIEELLFAARLHFETHGIERGHGSTSFGDAARTHKANAAASVLKFRRLIFRL
jgi:hypothetical protein